MVESGNKKVDSFEKLKDQILHVDSFNKCGRERGLHRITGHAQQVGGGQVDTSRFGSTSSPANFVGRRQTDH
uniref:Uncharacterized protein n=1 Tax=Hyaloperonospora arabidopsidis (strain Emoy2) TaxID=559515 RepID=M4B3W0_HYAAE